MPPARSESTVAFNRMGRNRRKSNIKIPKIYPSVSVDYYVIMPNHVHLILNLNDPKGGRQVASPTVSTIVGNMKRAVSKTIGHGIWQRSFHDHVIRDAKDYNEIATYIEANPLNWEADCFYGEGEENI